MIKVRKYDDLKECIAAYFECDVDEIPSQEGMWYWSDADGTRHSWTMDDALSHIMKKNCWSWVDDKEIIHIWYAPEVERYTLISVLAHELGHIERPYHRDRFAEEQKAAKYERVAETAMDIARDLLEGKNG